MKKGFLFLLFFLSSCNPATPLSILTPTRHPTTFPHLTQTPTVPATESPAETPTVATTAYPTQSHAEAIQGYLAIDLQCSHICWSRINPGITSAEDARALLGTSETEKYETFQQSVPVSVRFEKELVKSIYFGLAEIGYELSAFIQLFGEPDEIRIGQWPVRHCDGIAYLLYYALQKTVVEIRSGGSNGPNPNDLVSGMALNVEVDNTFFQSRSASLYDDRLSDRQPWLGYGHMQDYLPGQRISPDACLTPDPAFAP